MIEYSYEEEKTVALFMADVLSDDLAKQIIERGSVQSKDEAVHLAQFFWKIVNRSAEGGLQLPCEGSSQYWTEKLYNSLGGYLENAGYEQEWNDELDKA